MNYSVLRVNTSLNISLILQVVGEYVTMAYVALSPSLSNLFMKSRSLVANKATNRVGATAIVRVIKTLLHFGHCMFKKPCINDYGAKVLCTSYYLYR